MDKKIQRYYKLKQQQKEIEQELSLLRGDITAYCAEQGLTELESGSYRVKLVLQERKEYNDNKLYEALPDPDIWRMLSKPDPAKISSLLKLGVISDAVLKDAFATKSITLLQVERK